MRFAAPPSTFKTISYRRQSEYEWQVASSA
jgi:hypothetical protein